MPALKRRRDYFYLSVVVLHLTAMLGVDFVPFYPQSLCQPPDSPFHFIVAYRNWYITTMADPYYDHNGPGHFFDFLVYIELLVQFPLALYLTPRLFAKRPLPLSGQLAASTYGVVTSLCTAVVCHDLWYLGSEIIGTRAKQALFAAYLPYAVLPLLMAADMHFRILSRAQGQPQIKRE